MPAEKVGIRLCEGAAPRWVPKYGRMVGKGEILMVEPTDAAVMTVSRHWERAVAEKKTKKE